MLLKVNRIIRYNSSKILQENFLLIPIFYQDLRSIAVKSRVFIICLTIMTHPPIGVNPPGFRT